MASGYNEDFLDGITIKLPTFSVQLEQQILFNHQQLRDGYIKDYFHHSVIINKHPNKRSPAIVALNISQRELTKTNQRVTWATDDKIGDQNQLGDQYYEGEDNPWDRGHMAKRESAAWGSDAQLADDSTYFYSNACLQHKDINRDEWKTLEDWVIDLELDDDGKITTFNGPIYGAHDRSITPENHTLALIPAGFFKIICFKNKTTDKLDVRAFVVFQDAKGLKQRQGVRNFDNKTYQVTISEIEQLTGLRFEQQLSTANPLIAANESINPDLNITDVPECFEIGHFSEIINPGDKRPVLKDHLVDVFIAAAMVNPQGSDNGNEWISVINLGDIDIDLTDWSVADEKKSISINEILTDAKQRILTPGQSVVVKLKSPVILNNNKDVIKLLDNTGARIDRVSYSQRMVKQGKPIVFMAAINPFEK